MVGGAAQHQSGAVDSLCRLIERGRTRDLVLLHESGSELFYSVPGLRSVGGNVADALDENVVWKRARKSDAAAKRNGRRDEILEAAFEEFSRNGYATTTLDQIRRARGVTKGTIYVYFESKEHLFISMAREL